MSIADGQGRDDEDGVSVRSFVVRAVLEPDPGPGTPGVVRGGTPSSTPGSTPGDTPGGSGASRAPRWHGWITDTGSGARRPWRHTGELVRFISDRLAAESPTASIRGVWMAGPPLAGVVTDMLGTLAARLPAPAAGLPDPNVTLERVTERLVGLGHHRGAESTGALGLRTLRGGRLDARARFQLWGGTSTDVDSAVVALQTTLLDDADTLRAEGFLTLRAAETTLAEHVPSVNGWRKSTSVDLLYEYTYVDSDDAQSLIARIPITTDQDPAGTAPELHTVTDEIARWDDTRADPVLVRGPGAVHRITALVFVPGAPLGGTITVTRSDGTGAPVTHFPDLAGFLAATGRPDQPATNADVVATPAVMIAALGTAAPAIDLGDWDLDGAVDTYDGVDHVLADPIALPTPDDTLTIAYSDPVAGFDATGVIYLRVNAP